MIGVQVTREKIGTRGRDVALNCDVDGAKLLIDILTDFIERNKKDHEHIIGEDWKDEPFIKDIEFYELANDLVINYRA